MGCVTAVQFILFNFANYSPSVGMELKVSKEMRPSKGGSCVAMSPNLQLQMSLSFFEVYITVPVIFVLRETVSQQGYNRIFMVVSWQNFVSGEG